MLPSEMLIARRWMGEIHPAYARPTPENIRVAEVLIEAYRKHVGEKKSVLENIVSDLEYMGYDYRFVRGLAHLLDKRSVFTCRSKVDPEAARRILFRISGSEGYPTTPEARSKIIEKAATELNVEPGEIEASLYADLEDELVLESFNPLPGEDLLKQYNLSLTQTLLFNSVEMEFTASGNWQRLFRAVKKFGLIYDARREVGVWVKVEGPVSLFKLTRKYGTCMAKILPTIVESPGWIVNAKIMYGENNEIYDFEINWRRHSWLLSVPTQTFEGNSEGAYDSSVEEEFAERFKAFGSGWSLVREPEPLMAGNSVIIPDFLAEKDGVKVYLEIVGFWTEEYLKRKITKLEMIAENMLLLVDGELACSRIKSLAEKPHMRVIYYRSRIKPVQVLKALNDILEREKRKTDTFPATLTFEISGDIVPYAVLAQQLKTTEETLRKHVTVNPPAEYVPLQTCLISKRKMERLKEIIEYKLEKGKLTLGEAINLIRAEGVEDACQALTHLGYKIKWIGLDTSKSEVYKTMQS